MATVDLELNADLKKASKEIDEFSKESKSALDGLKVGFKTLAAAAGAVAGAFAVKKLVDAAAVQEQAIKSLNTALALTGDFTEEASKDFQNFASELQQNSTIGDETALSLVSLAKSMGATNEQTKEIIQAAADLSAVTGDSLETSVRNLSKTLGGLKGELGETQPELRNLTAEQLKAGAAIDIISKKYAGTAKELTKTFSGAVTQTTNTFGDLLEEIGMLITQNPLVIEAIGFMNEAFAELGKWVSDNRQAFIDFTIDAVGEVVKAFGFLIDIVGNVVAVFGNFNAVIDLAIVALADLGLGAVEVGDSVIKGFKSIINLGLQPFIERIESVAGALSVFGLVSDESLGKLDSALKSITLDSSTSGLEAMKSDIEAFRDAAVDGLGESSAEVLETKSAFSETADEINMFAERLTDMKNAGDDANKTLKNLSKANKELAEEAKKSKPFTEREFGSFGNTTITGAGIIAGGGALASGLAGGAQGANQLFQTGAAAAADAFLPGSGAIAGPLAGLLASGPEAAKAQVEAFIDQIPIIIDNVVEALPVVVEALAGNMDKVVIALAKGAPDIAFALAVEVPLALAESLPPALGRILTAFAEGATFEFEKLFGLFDTGLGGVVGDFGTALSDAFKGLVEGLGQAFLQLVTDLPFSILEGLAGIIPEIVEGLGIALQTLYSDIPTQIIDGLQNEIGKLGDSIFNAIVEPIKKVFDDINPFSGGGGGGGGGLGIKIGGFKLAEGGEVPPGFPNDTFPARLTSGENVIDQTTNQRLNEFLDGASSPSRVVIQVGEKELAEVILNLNRQGFRTA